MNKSILFGGEIMARQSGDMSVKEAGRKGGEKTSATHGREFYQDIGRMGGQRVRELIERGKETEEY